MILRIILKTCLSIVYIPGAYYLMGVCPMWIVIENTRAMLPINRNEPKFNPHI